MQVNRLFEIIYLLMENKSLTAKQLAERFEVSSRTIYRDLDTLSSSGIPVYANKGRGGGIRLLPNFVLNKSLLSKKEQDEILFALQGLQVTNGIDGEQTLQKLQGFFKAENRDWIDVDFSSWSGRPEEKEAFQSLKKGILESRIIEFLYRNAEGIYGRRQIEPYKLRFKHRNWYIQAFCLEKSAFRTFKIGRMEQIEVTSNYFTPRDLEMPELEITNALPQQSIELELWFSSKAAFRVYDEFNQNYITKLEDGNFLVKFFCSEDSGLYAYLLSMGEEVKVLSPFHVQKKLLDKIIKIIKNYSVIS